MSDHDRADNNGDNRYEHDHERHAGKGTVNHGHSENLGPGESSAAGEPSGPGASPDGASAPDSGSAGAEDPGPEGPGEEGPGEEGIASDELALRRMLHQAVQELEPVDDDGTLERLLRAVPARRARKRQAFVGMAAAALFAGTAIPALVHVSSSTGSDADPSIASHRTSRTQGGASQDGSVQESVESGPGSSPGKDKEKDEEDKKETPGEDKGERGSTGSTGGAESTVSDVNAPVCTSTQLGNATSDVGAPDAGGAVYGTFQIANVSAATCTVTGSGTVSALPQGAADGTKMQVVSHTSGDAATGLPDPSTEASTLVLQPGALYEVRFAWVPSETCPTVPDDNTTPPDQPTPTDGTTTGGDSGGTTAGSEGGTGDGTTTQLVRGEGVQDGSVVVSNTAEDGAPTTSATVPNACAGTVYRTGILATS